MKDLPLWVYILILFLAFIIGGIVFFVVGQYSNGMASFCVAFLALVLKYLVTPGNVKKKYFVVLAIILVIIIIALVTPQALNSFIEHMPSLK